MFTRLPNRLPNEPIPGIPKTIVSIRFNGLLRATSGLLSLRDSNYKINSLTILLVIILGTGGNCFGLMEIVFSFKSNSSCFLVLDLPGIDNFLEPLKLLVSSPRKIPEQ